MRKLWVAVTIDSCG